MPTLPPTPSSASLPAKPDRHPSTPQNSPHPGGRPTKLTLRVQAKIIREVRAGQYLETACKTAGISYETLRLHLVKGEKAKSGPDWEFLVALAKAEAEAEARSVKTLTKSKDWHAHAHFLARRWPKRWGAKTNGDPPGGPIVPISIIFRNRGESYDPLSAEAEITALPAGQSGTEPPPRAPLGAEVSSASALKGFVEIRDVPEG